MDLADLRTQYGDGTLEPADLDADPLVQFRAWLADAVAAGLREPNATALATVDPDGTPSVRMVLLKGLESDRFVFYTNLESRKATALASEPRCALCLWWDVLERQVRIEGRAERVDDATADAYFGTRPRGSQLGAWASAQSRPVAGRAALAAARDAADARFPDAVARPPFWGGYAVVADALEFWQGRPSRLHDRFRYERDGPGWRRTRLAP
jgi:pyridoxamine 5'-phosphate oxidase